MSVPTLNGVSLSHETAFSGFVYPQNAVITPLIGDGTNLSGNAVFQQGALTLRQATIAWTTLSTSDKNLTRALYESHAAVPYVDHEGNTTSVRVLDFAANVIKGSYWACTATLVEA